MGTSSHLGVCEKEPLTFAAHIPKGAECLLSFIISTALRTSGGQVSTCSKPLSPAPRTQEPEVGSVTNNQSQEREKYLPLSENVGENVVVKKKKKKRKPSELPRGQVLYGSALEIKPTGE